MLEGDNPSFGNEFVQFRFWTVIMHKISISGDVDTFEVVFPTSDGKARYGAIDPMCLIEM
jgi:hypothetical protein